MSRFVVCPSCERHVKRTDECCPFCEAPVPESVRNAVAPVPPPGLSRAQAYAFRAAIVASAAAVACGETGTPGPDSDGSTAGASTGGSSGQDATSSSGGSGGAVGSGGTSGSGGGAATGGTGGGKGGGGSGGTSGDGGMSGSFGTGAIPPPYGCVWPGPCGPIKA